MRRGEEGVRKGLGIQGGNWGGRGKKLNGENRRKGVRWRIGRGMGVGEEEKGRWEGAMDKLTNRGSWVTEWLLGCCPLTQGCKDANPYPKGGRGRSARPLRQSSWDHLSHKHPS